jgi:hypothetical protein
MIARIVKILIALAVLGIFVWTLYFLYAKSEKAPEVIKESIKARSEFYPLETQYQINNFWETSKIAPKPILSLNEVFTAKDAKTEDVAMDSYVASVAEQMKRYAI